MISCRSVRSNQLGFSLVEVMIAGAILGAIMLAAASFFVSQQKANNFLEFQSKRSQLRLTLLGQILNDPDNCKCLFNGAAPFSSTGPATLTGVTPTAIGRYGFVTAGVCASATMPQPLITSAGIDFMKSTSITLTNIVNISGQYSGELIVTVESMKDVLGPKQIPLSMPVNVSVSPSSPGMVKFEGCSTGGSSGSVPRGVCPPGLLSVGYDITTGILQCQPPTYQ